MAPVGSITPMPVVIDAGLARFLRICAGAGHPRRVMEPTFDDLLLPTDGRVEARVATGSGRPPAPLTMDRAAYR